jgi:GWxTD domain-containing protein
MEEARFRIPVRGTRSAFLRMMDLAAYPSGSYRLTVETSGPGGLFADTGKDFTVVWELVNWQKPLRDIVLEARLVLSGRQFDEFSRMDLGEQEIFMRDFWKKLDPTPQTAANETFDKFVARVRYADAQFGTYERGALTDRGYIFIRFGLPDDIINQPLPQTRDDLYEGLDKIITEYKIVSDGIMTEKSVKDVRPIIISPEKQRATRGTVGGDTGAFEVWTYGFKGNPLLPDDAGMTVDQGLRFLFVDKDGYGSYRLVGSSENMTGDARD